MMPILSMFHSAPHDVDGLAQSQACCLRNRFANRGVGMDCLLDIGQGAVLLHHRRNLPDQFGCVWPYDMTTENLAAFLSQSVW